MTEYCVNCGAELRKNADFCTKCGHRKDEPINEEIKNENYVNKQSQFEPTDILTPELPPKIKERKSNEIKDKNIIEDERSTINNTVMKKKKLIYFRPTVMKRVIAYLIDVFFVFFLPTYSAYLNSGFNFQFMSLRVYWNNLFLIYFAYFFVLEKFWNGKTIGKHFMQIKTVDKENLGPINTKQAILNALGKTYLLLPIDLFIGLFIKDESERGKSQIRLFQKWANTCEINLNLNLPITRCGKCGNLQPESTSEGDTCRICNTVFSKKGIIMLE